MRLYVLPEILYAYLSDDSNNGFEFAGFGANIVFFNVTLEFVILFVRFAPIIEVLVIAGNLVKRKSSNNIMYIVYNK